MADRHGVTIESHRSTGLAGWRRHWQAGTVLVVGLAISAGLAVSSALDYAHNEQRLTSLQTKLTASVLQTAQPQLQTFLGRVVGLTAMATDPGTAFRTAMAAELAPRGPFASATVAVVQGGQVSVLVMSGRRPSRVRTPAPPLNCSYGPPALRH